MNLDKDVQKWLKIFLIILSSIILFYFLKNIGVFKAIINILIALTPLYIAMFISWVMRPVAAFINKKLKLNYFLSCLISIIILFIGVSIIACIVVPEIILEIKNFLISISGTISQILNNLETNSATGTSIPIVKELNEFLASYNMNVDSLIKMFLENIQHNANALTTGITTAIDFVVKSINILFQIILGFLLAIYLMPSFDHFINLIICKIDKEKQKMVREDLHEVSVQLRQYIKSLVLDAISICLILTVVTWIFFGSNLDLMTCFTLAAIAACFNSISYVGPVIGSIPMVLVILQNFGIGGMFFDMLLILIAQQVEARLIYPLILGNSMHMHPVTVMVGLFAFSSLFGIFGMFISIPLLSVIKIFLVKFKIVKDDDI